MSAPIDHIWHLSELKSRVSPQSPFHIFLDTDSMRVEYLEYPAGHIDRQTPHNWDELYYIISGRSHISINDQIFTVQAGDNIFVPAHTPHHFHDIEEDLSIIVFFSKVESVT